MPHHEDGEEHEGRKGGRHGKCDDDEGHGKPGREHGEKGEGRHGKHGGGHGKHGGEHGKDGHGSGDESGGDDDDDEDEEDENEANEDEAKHPGCKRAGRIASRKWKRQHGVEVKTKIRDLEPEQRKALRIAKRVARRHFASKHEKA
eukprot:jgi/Undpi1/2397/HiC_scaffold_13.g05778.m1